MRAFVLCAVLFAAGTGTAPAAPTKCVLTPADKAANRRLTFDQFDQKGTTPSTWRRLEEAGCHAQALDAVDDYLANGPVQKPDIKSDILFHEAQTLAMMGREAEAAHLVAAAIPAGRAHDARLDWTTYLIGTWAFLVKDRARLQDAAKRISSEPGPANRIDGNVLRGLLACFDQPYAKAYDDCRAAPAK